MRKFAIAVLVSTAAFACTPAEAAWHSYVSHQLGISFEMPGDVKSSVGTFRGALAGPRQTIQFRSVDDNIEYKLTVLNFPQAQAEGADLAGERAYMFQDGKKTLMDTFGRVEP